MFDGVERIVVDCFFFLLFFLSSSALRRSDQYLYWKNNSYLSVQESGSRQGVWSGHRPESGDGSRASEFHPSHASRKAMPRMPCRDDTFNKKKRGKSTSRAGSPSLG